MNKLNLASKRELNPFWIFLPHFFAKGRYIYIYISLVSFVVMRNYGLFCGMLFGSCTVTGRTPTAVQVKSFTKQGQQRRVCRDSL